ncbi:MAG: N-6 DNA methylase [Oligoflexia bacterium]|nr:N-6 DNA methylase [Oligoflexia bacterium]
MKPEEIVRINYIKVLEEDFNYPKSHIKTEVSIQRGNINNPKNKKERADIVIYRNEIGKDQHKDVLAIIETKRPDEKDGVSQLQSYMSACSCEWGVWTNGENYKYFLKESASNRIKETFNIPKYGENINSIGTHNKKSLKPLKNLKPIFKRIFNILYSNTNISRREKLGSEMIKLIFCKIWDEKYYSNKIPNFRFTKQEEDQENYETCKKRITELFNEVKEELREDGIFQRGEEITLDAKSVCIVVGSLQQFSLMKTEKDVVGEAFEIFAESKLVGEKGEFFTPREIVKLAIQVLDPKPEETIYDPACGSGGFLIYALDHIWRKMDRSKKYKGSSNLDGLKKEIASKSIYGSDKEHDLVKIAKAYMSIIGDGKSNIFQENMLHPIEDFQNKPKEILLKNGKEKKFDYIITNPPFGSKIKVAKSDSKNFDLGHKWKIIDGAWEKTDSFQETEPQALFIELCLRFLKDKGKMAIILPETYLHAPTKKHIISYLSKDNSIDCVLDVPHNAFRPFCNAKTCLIFITKNKEKRKNITFGVMEEMGHDHLGKTKYRPDKSGKITDEIWDDTTIVSKELRSDTDNENKYVFTIPFNSIKNDVFVPRYYWDKNEQEIKKEARDKKIKLIKAQELLDKEIIKTFRGHGSPKNEYKGLGNIPYVRAGDIGNLALYKNPISAIPFHEYNKVKGSKEDLKYKDIVFVKEGSYRIGDVALVLPTDTKILLNSHCFVIRVIKEENEYNIDPFYLLYLLNHPITKKQLYNKVFIDTTLPNIGERWTELLLPFKENERLQVIKKMKDIFENRIKSEKAIISLYD